MLTAAAMVKVRIYVHMDRLDAVLHGLGSAELLHLTAVSGIDKYKPSVKPMDSDAIKRISELETRIKKLASAKEVELTPSATAEYIHIEKLEEELSKVEDLDGKRLSEIYGALNVLRRIEEAKRWMVRTERVALMEGWVPKKRLDELRETVEESSGGLGFVETVENSGRSEKEDKPPTLLSNPGFMKAFEKLTLAFGVPDYHEIDPTPIMAFSFPIIFGLMFGDLGHGVLLVVFGLLFKLLKRRVKTAEGGMVNMFLEASTLMILCGISATFFGYLYGELFGSEEWFHELTGLEEPPWFPPFEEPMTMLKYSIYVAVAQISLGLIIDIINKVRVREYVDAIVGPGLWLWLYLSGAYLVVKYGMKVFSLIFDFTVIGPYVVLPFAAMMLGRIARHRVEGFTEALDSLLSSFSNSISYSRILALKMIHTAFSRMLIPTSLIMMPLFLFGTLALIMILELLITFLHTLRLHWIEWFTKFYRGSGVMFQPFSLGVIHG
mgnify:CR=1 FL=1